MSGRGTPEEERVAPPSSWTRVLRLLVRGDEGVRVEEELAELYEVRREEAPGTENAWYRRQVLGFALRLPGLMRGGGGFRRNGGVDALRRDLAFATRQIRRRPGFALLAVVTAGLGIGAATAIFALVRAVVLAPLPYPEPDQLVQVLELTPSGDDFATSEPNLVDFRARNRTLQGLAGFQGYGIAARLTDEPIQLHALRVTSDFFHVLGGQAAIGRGITEEEAGAAASPVAVLSHAFWRDAFGGDAGVLGSTIVLDGGDHTIIGVMPAGWEPFEETDVWLPEWLDPASERGDHILNAVGRLAPGQTAATARADLGSIQADLSERFPESNGGWGVDVRPLKDVVVGEDTIRAGWILLGAVGLLLLLSCASVSNLLIARATARRREIALRTALGASAGRVLRQLMTESIVLALAGGVLGVAIALVGVPVLQAFSPANTPRIEEVRIDMLVLSFAVTVSVFAGILFGVTPAVHALRADVREQLAGEGRATSRGHDRLRELLVAGQVAVAFTMLVGVGLLAASYLRLQAEDTGLAVTETLAVPLSLPWERYDDEDRLRFARETEERVAMIPGVRSVGSVNITPFGSWNTVNVLSIEGMTFPDNDAPFARWRAVTPGYFESAGIRMVAGRTLRTGDGEPGSDRAAAVVTVAMAERIWGTVDAALGRRFAMSRNSTNWMTVVGVAADLEDNIVAEKAEPLFFFPDGGWWAALTLIVRTGPNAGPLAPEIRRAIWDVDPDMPVPLVESLADRLSSQAAGPRFRTVLMLAFGVVALTLALMGVYGVTHFAVSRRTREIGIRLALGARLGSVLRMMLTRSAGLAVAGIVVGSALAWAGTRALDSLLFRTAPLDPIALGGASVVVLAAALVAAWIPARKATRVDPASVLRVD